MNIYPKGKLREGDQGMLAARAYIKNGVLYIDFGKDVSWLALDKEYLRQFIDTLEENYKKLTKQNV